MTGKKLGLNGWELSITNLFLLIPPFLTIQKQMQENYFVKNKLSNFRPIQKLWIITKSYNIQNASKRTSWLKISENIFLEIIQSTFFSNCDVSIWKIRCSCFSTYIRILFVQKNDSRMFQSLGLPKKERLFLFNSFIVFCTFGFTFVF